MRLGREQSMGVVEEAAPAPAPVEIHRGEEPVSRGYAVADPPPPGSAGEDALTRSR
ncbi:MAG TPA: hypothetical protein VFN68_00255 [Acidimicrobiales bacterium]|nr:hypothetical protein [Acidimicrobiales bacterium]